MAFDTLTDWLLATSFVGLGTLYLGVRPEPEPEPPEQVVIVDSVPTEEPP